MVKCLTGISRFLKKKKTLCIYTASRFSPNESMFFIFDSIFYTNCNKKQKQSDAEYILLNALITKDG